MNAGTSNAIRFRTPHSPLRTIPKEVRANAPFLTHKIENPAASTDKVNQRRAAPNQLTEEEKAGGWKLLFDGNSTRGWHSFKKETFPAKGWDMENGWLHGLGKGGGDIISNGEFEQFELQWEWKQAPAGNSGLKYFVLETRSSPLGHEYQMIDDERASDASHAKRVTAAFYDVLKPTTKPRTKPAGEINQSRVVVKGSHVEHWLNGAKVLEYSCGSEEVKTAIAASKF